MPLALSYHSLVIVRESGRSSKRGVYWMPACAGMTMCECGFLVSVRDCVSAPLEWIAESSPAMTDVRQQATAESQTQLDVEIGDLERVRLDELAARLDHVAHQPREDVIGVLALLDLDLEDGARVEIERGAEVAVHAYE